MKLYTLGLLLGLVACASTNQRPAPATSDAGNTVPAGGEPVLVRGPIQTLAAGGLQRVHPSSQLKNRPDTDIRLMTIGPGFDSIEAATRFSPRKLSSGEMAVHAINVGQADAFLLEFACGVVMIDTGVQKTYQDNLKTYLDWFFTARRPDLNKTIDLLAISHSHADHANGVNHVFAETANYAYTVRNYIDNAYDNAAGIEEQQLMRQKAQHYQPVLIEQILWEDGATSPVMDPIRDCGDGVDPVIRVLWGGLPEVPSKFSNPNHQSVVMRVDYGEASFLFTGDIQTQQGSSDGGGLNFMLDDYGDNLDVFDVDALKVAHHGADNGTTQRFLDAITPCIAFMGVGSAQDQGPATATDHGHPTRLTMDLLSASVSAARPRRDVWTFESGDSPPRRKQVTKAIFGTAWDGEYVLYASKTGSFKVETQNGDKLPLTCS